MATKYLRTVGGNYSADASWSTISGGTADTTKPTASDDVILDALSGNLTIDANSAYKTFTEQAGYVGTVTHNAFTLTGSGNFTLVTGSIYTPLATSTLSFNTSATITTAGLLVPKIACTSGTLTLGSNIDFIASKLMQVTLSGTALDLNGKTISGNSAINRVLFTSLTTGTGAQITVNSGTFANADFRYITFSNASDLNLSAITGNSGDCGGNTLIGGGSTLTFTTPATQTATGTASFSWSTHGWTSRVPLPQDNVVVNNSFIAGRTVTMDMPRMGKTIDFSGCTGSPAFATSLDSECYGSLILKSGMTTSGNFRITFKGSGTYTLTTDSVNLTHEVAFDAPSGTYSLSNATTLKGIRFGSISFNSNNYNITLNNGFSYFTFDAGTKNINLGTSIVDFTSNTLQGGPISCSIVTGATCSLSNSTIKFSGTSTATKTCTWGGGSSGFDWGIFDFTVAGATGGCDFVGKASFAKIKFSDANNARTLRFTAGASYTTTIRDADGFDYVRGTSGKLITIDSITSAAHYLVHSTDKVSTDYLSVKNSNASGGSGFYAGANSTDVSGNSGWTFTVPPVSYFNIFGDEGMVS